jgi:hypothetical protein
MWVFGKGFYDYEIGFYKPDGKFCKMFERKEAYEAMQVVNYLNGGNGFPFDLKPPKSSNELEDIENSFNELKMVVAMQQEINRLKKELEDCKGASSQLLGATKYGYPI